MTSAGGAVHGRRRATLALAVPTLAFTAFAVGIFSNQERHDGLGTAAALLLALLPLIAFAALAWLWLGASREDSRLLAALHNAGDFLDSTTTRRLGLWIALAAAAGLFTELMAIRIHSSFFQLFAYFKNVSLLSCFLGLGLGYTLGRQRALLLPLALPALACQFVLLYLLRFDRVGSFLQNPVSEQLALGMAQSEALVDTLTSFAFLVAVFAWNALAFIPFGQLASRLMARRPKLEAYGANLLGSLAGIGLFYLLSMLWTPPAVWMLAAMMLTAPFLRRAAHLLPTALAGAGTIALLATPLEPTRIDYYSPYQVLGLQLARGAVPELQVNNVYYQRILDLEPLADDIAELRVHYGLPYRFKPRPEKVLIVGSGTGNDVAAAIGHGSGEIVAVEIDPAILALGRRLHPQAPYDAPNVTAVVDDARAYLRRDDQSYDLIVYGLLDSHTLLSGRSGVRLDSFVYTVEAFREARSRLREGGVLCLSFAVMKPGLARKLYLMLTEAFDGRPPRAFLSGFYDASITYIASDAELPPPPSSEYLGDVTDRVADPAYAADPSTDDWPFFYMPERRYPVSYLAMAAILLLLSLVLVGLVAPGAGTGFSAPCFFLGAGFMLVETKAITELAVVFGSTWTVIGAAIAAILAMAFLANLLVERRGAPPRPLAYGLLAAALLAGWGATFADLGALGAWSPLVLTALLTLPLFFSGFAFSSELSRAPSVAVAMSANLLGAMLGGLLEYNSMFLGFRALYLVALAMYVLAFLTARRSAGN